MFSITVAFGNVSAPLLFKTADAAKEAWHAILTKSATFEVRDDFGRLLFVPTNSLRGVVFEDMEASKEATIETALHNARIQAAAQKRASADPILRQPTMMNPPMLMPGGGNGRAF